jgi:2-oxoisovalerate dehydrogenase E1 component
MYLQAITLHRLEKQDKSRPVVKPASLRMAWVCIGQPIAEEQSWDLDIVDLRTLQPIDWDTIEESVKRTSRVLVLHEDTLTGGIGGDIAAYIAEHLFTYLDAPVMRVASLDTPIPFSDVLEKQFLASQRLYEQMYKLLSY